jgi:hypothetical protein
MSVKITLSMSNLYLACNYHTLAVKITFASVKMTLLNDKITLYETKSQSLCQNTI